MFRANIRIEISACEKLAVCDVTNLPYMDTNWQSISTYGIGYFVTSLTAYYSCADINLSDDNYDELFYLYIFNNSFFQDELEAVLPLLQWM